MRNLKIASYIIIIAMFFASCAQEQKPSEMILGEWKISDIQTSEEISEDMAEDYQKSIEEMKSS